jgi:hypothetical protein
VKLAIGTGSAGGADSDSGERCSSCGGALRTGTTRGATAAAFIGALGTFVDGGNIGNIGLLGALAAFGAAFGVGFGVSFVVVFFLAVFGDFCLAADFDASFLAFILVASLVGFGAAFLAGLGRLAPSLARPLDGARAGLRDFVALAMGVHANVCEASLSNGTDA